MLLLLVTLSSLLLAGIMTAIAWRTAHEERRRSEARVAALAAEIHPDLDLRPRTRGVDVSPELFTVPVAVPTRRSVGVAVAGTVLAAAALVAVGIVFSGTRSLSSSAEDVDVPKTSAPVDTTKAPAAPAPLVLVALGHEREGDRLVVRGTIRNPAAGMAVDHVTAVVFLFSRDGGFLTSGRATVGTAPLAPGGESTFTVMIPDAGDVGRYRVSFRTDDRVLPHVDLRDHREDKS